MRAGPRPPAPRPNGFSVCERDRTRPMLGVALFALVRVPRTGPRGQDQEQAGVARRGHLMALLGHPVRHGADAGGLALAVLGQLDLAIDDDQIRVLVDLVLLELLAGRQVDRDSA